MIYTFEFDFEDFFSVPKLRIGVDQTICYDNEVKKIVEIDVTLEHGPHELWIEHHGKDINWTNDRADHHIFIRKIYFDSIDLDQLDYCPITHRGRFYPRYEPSYRNSCLQQEIDLPEFIRPNHYLGHNGIWKLDFSCPEFLWIIKEQNPSGIHLEDTIFSTGSETLASVKKFFNL